jgi:hypothetical protein
LDLLAVATMVGLRSDAIPEYADGAKEIRAAFAVKENFPSEI